ATGTTCCDGTCVNLQTDPQHCGTCTTTCSGTTPDCCGGSCVNLQTEATHCGSCGTDCTAPAHAAAPSCSSGTCTLGCDAGWANCNSDPRDGCETNLNSNANCGACGTHCTPGHSRCEGGRCQSCTPSGEPCLDSGDCCKGPCSRGTCG